MIDRCIMCGSGRYVTVGEKDDRTIVRCTDCELLRTLNPPDEYFDLYTEGDVYHAERQGQTPYEQRYIHDIAVAKKRWPHLMAQLRLLDVGCANGGFLRYASQQGIRVEGLEPNPNMARFAASHADVPVHTSWDTVDPDFDMITYHDVIEHIVDPKAELVRARGYLNNSGLIVVDTPDANDPRFEELGLDWHHMKPREHLWFFTDEHLVVLLQSAGYYVLEMQRPIQGKIVAYARRM